MTIVAESSELSSSKERTRIGTIGFDEHKVNQFWNYAVKSGAPYLLYKEISK